MVQRIVSLLILLLVSTSVFTACATTATDFEAMEYADQAEFVYRQGEQALERRDYLTAMTRFNTVRNEYAYSRFAALANLGIADAYFAQNQYASAVQQYRAFMQLYPRHERVQYAHWQVAQAFYSQIPSDYFFLPPSYERDLSSTHDAVRELRIFLRRFEDSEYAEEATTKLRESLRRLADHEFYVARYYLREDNPRATANRLTYLLRNYSGLGLDPEALYLLGRAYLQLDEADRAVTAWLDLVENYPEHNRSRDVRPHLQSVGALTN